MRYPVAVVLLIGCGDPPPIESVQVQAYTLAVRKPQPNLMVALDRSVANPAVKAGLRGAIETHGAGFRAGLTVFPSDGACGDPRVVSNLGAFEPLRDLDGVTPVTDRLISFGLLAAGLPLNDSRTEHLVLLITGGADTCGGEPLNAARELRLRNVRTIVVGFGVSAADAPGLDALARVGGVQQTCTTDTECVAGGTCDGATGVCSQAFYAANDEAELKRVFDSIFETAEPVVPCLFKLEWVPSSPDRITVIADGAPSTEWRLEGDEVRLYGGLCDRIRNSTVESPVQLELRVDTSP